MSSAAILSLNLPFLDMVLGTSHVFLAQVVRFCRAKAFRIVNLHETHYCL